MDKDGDELILKGDATRIAARRLATIPTSVKNQALANIANSLQSRQEELLEANLKDCLIGEQNHLSEATLDRLRLSENRLDSIGEDVMKIASLSDPIGETFDSKTMSNGLQISKKRVPLGVVGVIYESRPNITIDLATLCIKSGNAVILRGGKEAINSNIAITSIVKESIAEAELPSDSVQLIESTDREIVGRMLRMNHIIDLIIPRGGADLVRRVANEAQMPAITGGIGVCHTYVDKDADINMAVNIVNNAKVQRPSVCNALDTVIVHSDIAQKYLSRIANLWAKSGVEMRCDPRAVSLLNSYKTGVNIIPAKSEDWGTEFLAMTAAVKLVDSFDEAIEHIESYGSGHSEAIVTDNPKTATRFVEKIDASAVMVNTSTRFNDGGQFGLGAEVAISTSKFHARGPMGLKELTSYKWVVMGSGQIRT